MPSSRITLWSVTVREAELHCSKTTHPHSPAAASTTSVKSTLKSPVRNGAPTQSTAASSTQPPTVGITRSLASQIQCRCSGGRTRLSPASIFGIADRILKSLRGSGDGQAEQAHHRAGGQERPVRDGVPHRPPPEHDPRNRHQPCP